MRKLFYHAPQGHVQRDREYAVAVAVSVADVEQTEWANIIFDFQNSYITIGGAGTIPNVSTDYLGKSVFVNLQYEAK